MGNSDKTVGSVDFMQLMDPERLKSGQDLKLPLPYPIPSPSQKEVKPGWKTTEFWVVVLSMLATNAQTLSHMLDPKWGAIVMSLGGVAYAISRGLAKR